MLCGNPSSADWLRLVWSYDFTSLRPVGCWPPAGRFKASPVFAQATHLNHQPGLPLWWCVKGKPETHHFGLALGFLGSWEKLLLRLPKKSARVSSTFRLNLTSMKQNRTHVFCVPWLGQDNHSNHYR